MGRKKKFIDKKKSATFHLMARDTSDPNYTEASSDQVFFRVDNNQYTPQSFFGDDNTNDCGVSADPDSIFADAPEDCDDEDANGYVEMLHHNSQTTTLPDHIRREILELGYPDDGYNYLAHLREIKNTGGGSAYYHNPKADFHKLPQDVKAYDASRVEVSKINDASEKFIYGVASKTVSVRLQRVADPEIAALLDDDDSSKFGSDIEDLEEDFVVRANLLEETVGEEIDEKLSSAVDSSVDHLQSRDSSVPSGTDKGACMPCLGDKKPRVLRPLDEQFDLLELNEYADDSEEECIGYMDEEECQESLTEKLNNVFKVHPPSLLHLHKEADDNESPEPTAEVIRRCKEYAEKYNDENDDLEEVLVEESSDESEVWDCETIVTTYSTLDNHPGKIGAPEARRKKQLVEAISGSSLDPNQLITLKGKDRLPVDFLPRSRKNGEEKRKDEKDVNEKRSELLKKPRCQETKEEKKERKSAVKLERREAREVKKEMKGLYKYEAHRAQKVAAFTGPSSIHLM
ncbi:hypothetical protein ACS0TY_013714 [Phlomoides rotata]